MTFAGYAAAAAVVALLGAIAAGDARRARISPVLVGLLLLAGAAWLLAGGGREAVPGPLWVHGAGALAGAGVPALLIIAAEAAGRRWPIYPGDAMLMGAVGAILGARALAWSVALGCGLALAQRVCIQVRRGRPVTAGWLPAGPGLALGAALVFGFVNAGMAQDEGTGAVEAERIEAVELAPPATLLPAALADKEIAPAAGGELAFSDAVAALGKAAGIGVTIEERPSRVAGGRVALPDPPPVASGGGGRLSAVVEDLARSAGYGWGWREGTVVFFRYWDSQWAAERSVEVAAPEAKPVESGLFERVWAFLSGRGEERAPAAAEAIPGTDGVEAASQGEEAAPGAEAGDESPAEVLADGVAWGAETEPELTRWEVRPDEQQTLKGVLEDWAGQAEWRVAWEAEADFSVGAEAAFEGGFLEAVDGLLSDPAVSRALEVRAYANRYLVVREAGR